MANWICPTEGLKIMLAGALDTTGIAGEDYVLDLYQNNYTPISSSTGSNFTISSFTGYAQVVLPASDFPTPTITGSAATTTNSTPGAFSCTGGSAQTAYGAVMRGATSGKVYAAALFDAPRSMSNGATETVTVTLTLLSQN